ncbi:MAG: hypothetical protein JWO67_5660, partial [Streptosporangiaceae bacterium]|nr:hypothetical protein [Streptosporangiaceae bacterium]
SAADQELAALHLDFVAALWELLEAPISGLLARARVPASPRFSRHRQEKS